MEKSLTFNKPRFANAANFTFIFVGSFTPAAHPAAGRNLPGQPAGERGA